MEDKANYTTCIKEEIDEVALAGYIFNDPQGLHFYPIYINNPHFGETRVEPRISITTYIKYVTDYMYISGTMGIGHEICTIPVMVGWHARQYTHMTEVG